MRLEQVRGRRTTCGGGGEEGGRRGSVVIFYTCQASLQYFGGRTRQNHFVLLPRPAHHWTPPLWEGKYWQIWADGCSRHYCREPSTLLDNNMNATGRKTSRPGLVFVILWCRKLFNKLKQEKNLHPTSKPQYIWSYMDYYKRTRSEHFQFNGFENPLSAFI